jgi:ferredoxin
MMFTGAVKNLFGMIPGLEKAQFHLKVPDRDDFAEMLVDLLLACHPALCIMDGVVAMEGDGPSGGTPKQVGALIASADAVALDVVASAIAGFDPMDVYTNKAAAGRGLGPLSADDVEIVGEPWRDLAPARFARPAPDLSRNLPPRVARWMRKRIASRPVLERREACTNCRTCEKNCPVTAITMSGRKPAFDYDVCIRCYCCQELCPERAIGLKTPWFVRSLVLRGGSERA